MVYRREIDGLRAIAASAVVLYHARLGGAGYVGVDLFFVISGYLITALLLREHSAAGRIDLTAFYARRVRRIFPAVIVVLLAVLAGSALLLESSERIEAMDSAAASALFAANLFFQHHTFGYFDGNAETMPLLHLWSLSVEEQFYLVWPVLLMGLLRWKVRLLPALTTLALASFALAYWLPAPAAFYQMPPRFWELAVGGLIAAMPARPLPRWLPWLGLLVVLDACLVPVTPFPGIGALPAVAGAAIIIAAVHGGAQNKLLASRPFVGLGLISYALYLWHWPLLALYKAQGGDSMGVRLALCAVAVLLAVASFYVIERPFRRRGADRPVVAAGFGVFAVLALCAFALSWQQNQTPIAKAARDWPANKDACSVQADDPRVIGPECASGPGKIRVALWGDSQALAWQPLAWELADRQGVAAIDYTKNACKPAIGYAGLQSQTCIAWNDAVLPRLKGMDTVILVGRWDSDHNAAEAGMRKAIAALSGVRKVYVLGPTPVLQASAPGCLDGGDQCAIPRAAFDQATAADRKWLAQLATDFPNVEYVNAGPWFCDSMECPAVRGGMALYWDNAHISSSAARAFAAGFR